MAIQLELFEPVPEVNSHKPSSPLKDDRNLVDKRQFDGGRPKTKATPANHCAIATHPLAAAELTHATLHGLMVVGDKTKLLLGRPWITFLLDQRTRMPLGFHLSLGPPSVPAVAQCLKNAVLPKSYIKKSYPDIRNEWACSGVPARILFGPSKEFVGSKKIKEMAAALGFHADYSPSMNAWHENFIKRFLVDANQQLSPITGNSSSNIAEHRDNPAQNDAIITYGDLLDFVHKWVIDDYAQAQDRSLNDSPAKVWDREIVAHPRRPLPDLAHLGASLCCEERVLSREGIEFENLFYNHHDIAAWRCDDMFKKLIAKTGDKVKIQYDPTDMSKIWVLDPRNHQFIEAPCREQQYAKGLTLWEHRAIRNHCRAERKKAMYQRKEAISDIFERACESLRPIGKSTSKNTTSKVRPHPHRARLKNDFLFANRHQGHPSSMPEGHPPALSCDDSNRYVDE